MAKSISLDLSNLLRAEKFRSAFPWWGGDLQTLRNKIIRPPTKMPGRFDRMLFPMSDGSGDQLSAVLNHPDYETSKTPGPLVVLIHGLTGDENSDYVIGSTAFHLKRGRRVLRLNLRGAGPSRASTGGHYHSGCAPDIRDALSCLSKSLTSQGIYLIGYSLGGNILVNFLATYGTDFDIRGAVTVSASIYGAGAVKRLMKPRNRFYHAWLLSQMKRECLAPGAKLETQERKAISEAETIYEFDDKFTAPRNGFKDADDYYARTAGWYVAPKITVPTLLIHARNDPWIPTEPYDDLLRQKPPNLLIAITDGGGHVGFHGQGFKETWHDRCAETFFASLLKS